MTVSVGDGRRLRVLGLLATLAACLVSTIELSASIVRATVNDATGSGALAKDQFFGEEGFDPAHAWDGSSNPLVIDEDLVPPPITGYALVQEGNPRCIRTSATDGNPRHVQRPLAQPLTDQVWGSFLVRVEEGHTRGGVTFNVGGYTASSPRILALGTSGESAANGDKAELFVGFATVGNATVNDVFDYGAVSLVLYRIDFTNEAVYVWVNPDLADLGAPTYSSAQLGTDPAGGAWTEVNRVGISSYGSNGGSLVDMVLLSNGPSAFEDVTGVPSSGCPGGDVVKITINEATGGGADAKGQFFGELNLDCLIPWDGSLNLKVIDLDLEPPAGTNFALSQPGEPRSLESTDTNGLNRHVWRPVTERLTASVWGSFLVRVREGHARGGLSFNQEGYESSDPRILVMSTEGESAGAGDRGELFVGLRGIGELRTPNVFDYGRDALVLFHVDFESGSIAVWVNPDVTDSGEPTFSVDGIGLDPDGVSPWTSINRVGIVAYGQAGGTIVDMVHLSDGDSAYEDVTGVPPPSPCAELEVSCVRAPGDQHGAFLDLQPPADECDCAQVEILIEGVSQSVVPFPVEGALEIDFADCTAGSEKTIEVVCRSSEGLPGLRGTCSVACCPSEGCEEVLIEAESFTDKGGWTVDQQFVEVMGSPYLLAHGLGSPVEDAQATVGFPATGTYRLWVRTKDWVPDHPDTPGTFKVSVNSTEIPTTFGTTPGWNWVDGGMVEIADTQVEIRLRDLTGFDARCDALFFTTDASFGPPNGIGATRPWRRALSGMPPEPPSAGPFDAVVVGGGIAGCAAAIAAAREGLLVALIQDRPHLGGNASQEVRVHTLGLIRYGIVDEINTDHYPNGSDQAITFDARRRTVLENEPNISLFLSTRAYHVNKSGNRITSVDAKHIETGEERRFSAPVFIDCTGDGWIGYWAGARYMMGREGRSEFGETLAPTFPDHSTMGSSLLWTSSDAGQARDFPEVPWAMDVAKDYTATKGEWFWEYGFHKNTIYDAEDIRDHLLRAIYGSFYNAKRNPQNANLELHFVAHIAGKRESRRLLGDYLLTQDDVQNHPLFPDGVVRERRDIDLHRPLPGPYDFLSAADFTSIAEYSIPFRCLYSADIDNLMMAGRCLSATHVGLGSPRVMNTCGQMGVAVGTAASICKKHNTTPRGVYEDHLPELRALLGVIDLNDLPENTVVVLDNADPSGVTITGVWPSSTFHEGYYGSDYIHDNNEEKGSKSVLFRPEIPKLGLYKIYLSWTASPSRATNVPVTITRRDGTDVVYLNQSDEALGGRWNDIGTYAFEPGTSGTIEISNANTSGHVIVDAVAIASVPTSVTPFTRADANGDGAVDVSDPVHILLYLFRGGSAPGCRKAADANDTGTIDVSDPVSILSYLFTGGPPIPEPGATCGEDPTLDGLTCDAYPPCE